MPIYATSFERYIFKFVAWQNIVNCLNNLVHVFGCVGTEPNIHVSYRQLRQNNSHTRIKTLLQPLDINVSSNLKQKLDQKEEKFVGRHFKKLWLHPLLICVDVCFFVLGSLFCLVELSLRLILCCVVHAPVCLRWLSHGTRASSDKLLDGQAKALDQPV